MSTQPASASSNSERPALSRAATSGTVLLPRVEPLSPFEASFLRNTPVIEWTPEDIHEWLISINCDSYFPKFSENDVDGEVLLDLGKEELKQLVHRVGDRLKVLRGIKKLKAKSQEEFKEKQKEKEKEKDKEKESSRVGPSPKTGYFAGVDAFNSDRYDQGSLRFQYTDGNTRFVNVSNSRSAKEVKQAALSKVFPSISQAALDNWSVLRDGTPLTDTELLDLARNPNANITLVLEATKVDRSSRSLRRESRPGERPTSQHVSAHLSEYFPNADSGELEQTVRNSIIFSKRLSTVDNKRLSHRISNLVIPEEPSPTQEPIPSRGTSRQYGINRRFSSLNLLPTTAENDPSGSYVDSSTTSTFTGPGSNTATPPAAPAVPPPTAAKDNLDDRQFLDRLSNEEISPSRWIQGQVIGSGSFGTVYMGMNTFTGELLAVKQVEVPTGAGIDEHRKKKMVEALKREITLMRDFHHENIVQYRGFTNEDNVLNIFLEYVPGGSLASLLGQYGSFNENIVRLYVHQILTGLAYLHERSIIHRDIKGANILVNDKGQIKISDFGLSKKIETQQLLSNRQSMQGSAFWMAPEVVKQVGTTVKADIWSLGCLVIELLTGTHPFPQLTQMQAIFKLGNSVKPTIPDDISPSLQDFLSQTLEIEYNRRPTAEQLRHHVFFSQS